MICEDFAFHWGHKFLHLPIIYPYIHKIHHEHSVAVGIANNYFHPLEFLIAGVFPTVLGSTLLGKRMHLFTYIVWYSIRITEDSDGHSGYEFSWSPYRLIPFSTSATYHDFHHLYNVGNFSSFFTLWDTICGTNSKYYELHEKLNNEGRITMII
jgi:sterol desaturase/sphingolipid hydroxylase (fatty acid hydroxylase superfamily)